MVAIPVRALWAYRLGYRTRRRMLVKLLRRGARTTRIRWQMPTDRNVLFSYYFLRIYKNIYPSQSFVTLAMV
jgi:hypothetical protein